MISILFVFAGLNPSFAADCATCGPNGAPKAGPGFAEQIAANTPSKEVLVNRVMAKISEHGDMALAAGVFATLATGAAAQCQENANILAKLYRDGDDDFVDTSDLADLLKAKAVLAKQSEGDLQKFLDTYDQVIARASKAEAALAETEKAGKRLTSSVQTQIFSKHGFDSKEEAESAIRITGHTARMLREEGGDRKLAEIIDEGDTNRQELEVRLKKAAAAQEKADAIVAKIDQRKLVDEPSEGSNEFRYLVSACLTDKRGQEACEQEAEQIYRACVDAK